MDGKELTWIVYPLLSFAVTVTNNNVVVYCCCKLINKYGRSENHNTWKVLHVGFAHRERQRIVAIKRDAVSSSTNHTYLCALDFPHIGFTDLLLR